jgi:hypothetical protein
MQFIAELLFTTVAVLIVPFIYIIRFSPQNRYLRDDRLVGPSYWGIYAEAKRFIEPPEFKIIPLLDPPPKRPVVIGGSRSYARGRPIRSARASYR